MENSKLKLTETATKNHAKLFPNHVSTLQITDPELIEIFDNWAFDEVISYGNLETKTRVIIILAATIAMQTLSEYKVMLGAALNVGITPVEIKEILYQSVPYVGIAKAFDFIHATNEFLQSTGVALPLESQSTTTPETRFERGLALKKKFSAIKLTKCIGNHRRIKFISKNICRRIVSVIITPEAGWI